MGQSQETRRPQREEEDTEVDDTQTRRIGNQALKEEVEKTDKTLDLIDELLKEPEFSTENAELIVQSYEQMGGQ